MLSLQAQADRIPTERKAKLDKLVNYIRQKDFAHLVFICTHNSRRSHLAMIWATVAAHFFRLGYVPSVDRLPQVGDARQSGVGHTHRSEVFTYSGGTEATAMNPRIVRALLAAGFKIKTLETGENPIYEVNAGEDFEPIRCFSKVYDHEENPKSDFAAIMVCSSADADCPYVPGADFRLALPYQDPKRGDDLPAEVQIYQDSLLEIGREMVYVFSRL
ncbi:MAG: protein-tyrosine-phosphatase [Bacteroidota bacterium]